jgi:hypothetical protein
MLPRLLFSTLDTRPEVNKPRIKESFLVRSSSHVLADAIDVLCTPSVREIIALGRDVGRIGSKAARTDRYIPRGLCGGHKHE